MFCNFKKTKFANYIALKMIFNYFKTYSDLPYLLGHGLTKGVEKGVVNQFMYQYAVMTMNMGLIASFGDYVVGYKWKNKLLGAN